MIEPAIIAQDAAQNVAGANDIWSRGSDAIDLHENRKARSCSRQAASFTAFAPNQQLLMTVAFYGPL